MKVIIINSSTNIEYRVDLIYEYLVKRGCEVKVIASDFMHASKQRRSSAKYPYTLLNTYPYMKNISLQRLYSHYKFSRDAWKLIMEEEADILYLVVPQNSNAEIAGWYRRRYPKALIVIDIVDMWPESLPIKGTESWPFTMWAKVRNRNLKYADKIVTECRYYQDMLKPYSNERPMVLMPWLKKYNYVDKAEAKSINREQSDQKHQVCRDKIRLCYLGAVNNIIDTDKISEIIALIGSYAKVELNIIGKGERMPEFIKAAESVGAEVINHGAVYDDALKKQIMDGCDFGLNIMKATVCVGLTMKSIDYMAVGLPMINNIPGDTKELIKEYKIGINIDEGISEANLFRTYDRAQIQQIFKERYDAKNIGRYLEEVIGKI